MKISQMGTGQVNEVVTHWPASTNPLVWEDIIQVLLCIQSIVKLSTVLLEEGDIRVI